MTTLADRRRYWVMCVPTPKPCEACNATGLIPGERHNVMCRYVIEPGRGCNCGAGECRWCDGTGEVLP